MLAWNSEFRKILRPLCGLNFHNVRAAFVPKRAQLTLARPTHSGETDVRPTDASSHTTVRYSGNIYVTTTDVDRFLQSKVRSSGVLPAVLYLPYFPPSEACCLASVTGLNPRVRTGGDMADQAGRPSVETRVPMRSPAMTRAILPIFL